MKLNIIFIVRERGREGERFDVKDETREGFIRHFKKKKE